MKKFILLCVVALVVFTACQTIPSDGANEPLGASIEVRSIEELETMRQMATSSDRAAVEEYLRSVSGADDQKDLIRFLALVDSVPYPVILEGDITWISYSFGQSIDTGKEYNILFVTTEAENGDWVRVEYNLLEDDVAAMIDASVQTTPDSLLPQPLQSSDKKMSIHTETREAHPSGTGTIITWGANIEGTYAKIVYFVSGEDSVETSEVCLGIYMTQIR